MKKIILAIVVLLAVAVGGLYFTGNQHVLVAIQKTYLSGQTGPSIDDYDKFNHRRVAAANYEPWPKHVQRTALSAEDKQWLDSLRTASFLVIYRDSLLIEEYFDDYTPAFMPNVFSAAKSLVSMAIGVLVRDGEIESLDEPAAKYIPEIALKKYPNVSIRQLLQMTSGIGFDENYKNPLGYQAKVYYGKDIHENTLAFNGEKPPGEEWFYAGGNTILLAMIIERVSGQRLSNYFSKHIWQQIGAEADAWWTVDAIDGVERASCCFYAITRDLARLGKLYLNGGQWNGREIIPEWYVQESLTPVMVPDASGEPVMHYGYQWWLGPDFFQAQGMLGQYIIVVPDEELIIVRTGHRRYNEKVNGLPGDAFRYIEIAKTLLP